MGGRYSREWPGTGIPAHPWAIDWRVAMKDWAKVTGIELNDVRPQLGSSAVSTDVTSPSKLTNGFIVE